MAIAGFSRMVEKISKDKPITPSGNYCWIYCNCSCFFILIVFGDGWCCFNCVIFSHQLCQDLLIDRDHGDGWFIAWNPSRGSTIIVSPAFSVGKAAPAMIMLCKTISWASSWHVINRKGPEQNSDQTFVHHCNENAGRWKKCAIRWNPSVSWKTWWRSLGFTWAETGGYTLKSCKLQYDNWW